MKFVFSGTVEELKDSIRTKSVQLHRDIFISHDEPNVIKIGFQRLGHSGGRFFVANIAEENGYVTLYGTIENLKSPMPTTETRSTFHKIRDTLIAFTLVYVFLGLVPWTLWAALDIPHPWISFLIPGVIILFCQLLPLFHKTEPNFEAADNRFLQLMNAATGGDVAIPTNSQELYGMLLDTQGMHSIPKINDDVIRWELYDNIYVEAAIFQNDTIIDIIDKNLFRGSYMHWHPELEEIYDDLCTIGKKGNILVLRKTISGAEVYYVGEPDSYRFSHKKKWHWGKLIYLAQK